MQGLIERYMKSSRGAQPEPAAMETQPAPDPVRYLIIQLIKFVECI